VNEPYYSILASPQFLRANFTPEHEQAFFETGELLVEYVFGLIEQRLAPDFAPTSILNTDAASAAWHCPSRAARPYAAATSRLWIARRR
jgi:hypothetical protein